MQASEMLLLGRKIAQEHLASFLVARCRDASDCGAGKGPDPIRLPMTRGEIADHLGLTIETVSRTFSRFHTEGRVATPSNNEVVMLDPAWLERMAAGLGSP